MIRALAPGLHRSGSPESDPPGLHPGSRWSRQLLANIGFGRFPIGESSCTLIELLAAFVEDVLVPGGRRNSFRSRGEVFPDRFHDCKLLVESHVFERQVDRHE